MLRMAKEELTRRAAEAERAALERNAEAIRLRCASLAGFVREAWKVLEPDARYVHSWHIDAICEHLKAVTDGRINRLLINIPPGSSKSLIVSVLWPAWEWGPQGRRSLRYLATAFNETPVKRDTRKMRDLILSSWYQALWPEVVLTRTGETSFANSSTGTREGIAFGSLTSQRGDRLIIDDPHSVDTAESETERAATTRRFREGATNRLNDQDRSAIVVVMQRLHEQDISGVILKLGMGYVHLRLPMEFEADNPCETKIGFSDPRQVDGDLLDPVRFPRQVVEELRRDMGSYAYAGQYQQRPAPREGGLFQRHWFKLAGAVPVGATRVRKWDLAGSTAKGADWTVGVLMARDAKGFLYVENVVRKRLTPAGVEELIVNTAALDGRAVVIHLNEDPAQAGKFQAEYLVRALQGYRVLTERETGSKETRAGPFASQAEAGNVRVMADAPWLDVFLDELCTFPMGTHDYQVDAASGAFQYLALNRPLVISDALLKRSASPYA